MHRRITRFLLSFCWFIVVSAIVINILFVSLVYLMSEDIDQLRPQIFEWAESKTGQIIKTDKLGIEWQGVIPHLKLSDVQILDQVTQQEIIHFDEAKISIDLYRSLRHWQLTVGRLDLSGLDIRLLHRRDGSLALFGLTGQGSNHDKLIKWMMQQSGLNIHNSKISWIEESGQLPNIVLSALDLQLHHQHLIQQGQFDLTGTAVFQDQGKIKIEGLIIGKPEGMKFDLHIKGEQIKLQHLMSATMNTRLKQYQSKSGLKLDLAKAQSDFELHLKWQEGQLDQLSGSLDLKSESQIKSQFLLAKDPKQGWKLSLPNVTFFQADHHSKPFSVDMFNAQILADDQIEFELYLNHLRLKDLIYLIPETTNQSWPDLIVAGEIDNTHIQYSQVAEKPSFKLRGELRDITTLAYKKIPGITGFNGQFKATTDQAQLFLDSKNLIINSFVATDQADQQLKLDTLSGEIEFKKEHQGWQVLIEDLIVSNPFLAFQLDGKLDQQTNAAPIFDLHGKFIRGDAGKIVRSFPANLFTPKLKGWLDRSIIAGDILGGDLFFQGALDQFPFEQGNGLFEIRINVDNGILDYYPGWPRIDEISAELLFSGKRMLISGESGLISQAKVRNTIVEIPNLASDDAHLLIKGNALGKMDDGLRYLNHSPLKKTTGKKLEQLNLVGDLDLDLEIDLPLTRVQQTEVKGVVHLNNNALQLESLDLSLNDLNGDFLFTEALWKANKIGAMLFDNQVSISLDIDSQLQNAAADVLIHGMADQNYIKRRLQDQVGINPEKLGFLDKVKGSTAWQAKLSLPLFVEHENKNKETNTETSLEINSSLLGLSIPGPFPLGKSKNQSLPLTISTKLTKKQKRQVDFQYADLFGGKIEFKSVLKQLSITNIDLHFGSERQKATSENKYLLQANGYLPRLDMTAWKNFLDQNLLVGGDVSSGLTTQSFQFNLAIDQLAIAGQSLTKSIIEGVSLPQVMELGIKNQHIHGRIFIPYQISDQPLKADFERLILHSEVGDKNASEFSPDKIPALEVTSKKFIFNDLNLGALNLQVKPTNHGLMVEHLEFKTPNVLIDIKGSWTEESRLQRSTFNIAASSKTLTSLLSQFGFETAGVDSGATEIAINAQWLGSPVDFSLSDSRAELSLDVKQGRFTDIDNRAGKVFGLLSIQTLGRRLALDFNDLFEKGFTFDTITGDFDISRGNAFTQNLNMSGPSANIKIKGRIGLAVKDYDQQIIVTPSVSDSLPVASALFGPVGAGVGAAIYIAEQVIPQIPNTIDKILKKEYTLTGSWKDPQIAEKVPPVTNAIKQNKVAPSL